MRSKLLRAIFPDRASLTSNNQLQFPLQANKADPSNLVARAFSQVTPALPNTAPNGLTNLDASIGSGNGGSGTETFENLSRTLDRLRAVTETQTGETKSNTSALTTNTTAKQTSEAISSVNKASGGLFGGLTALPLVSGLLQLFGGGSSSNKQQPLTKYTSPPSFVFDSTVQNGSDNPAVQNASYDRFGNPRITTALAAQLVPDYGSLVAMARSSMGDASGSISSAPSTSTSGSDLQAAHGTATTTSNVTVNIQAMDSRSFLDRSQDIAQAVREAMLNMHSINDVVNDL